MEDRRLSVDEIGVYLGVKRDTVYSWISQRGMPAQKIGRLWKFKKDEVDEWIRKGGAHSSRTIMLDELTDLFAVVDAAAPKAYKQAILEDNRAVARMLIRESVTPVVTFRHRDQTITTPRHETFSWNAC